MVDGRPTCEYLDFGFRGYGDSHGDSNGDSCGYGMGMGIEMPSPRQPWKFRPPLKNTLGLTPPVKDMAEIVTKKYRVKDRLVKQQ